jgi:peptidoglycan hydrolase-like protein with peptidoglycan-binding domain
MPRDTRSKIAEVVTMGAICLMAASPVVAQTDRSGSGAAGSPARPAEAMPGTGATTMTGDSTSTDLRGLPDPPETVRRAQRILKSEGFDPGPINGVLGDKTEEALLQYQQKHGIEATGWLDRETRAKLGV